MAKRKTAKKNSKSFEETLWDSANKLRGSVEPADAHRRYARVLAAIDPLASDPGGAALSRKIMELAISMANLEGSGLHVVHVWETLDLPQGASAKVWKQWEITERSQVKHDLHRFLRKCDLGEDPEVHFISGRPASRIPEVAAKEGIDLLVMGTVHRTGVRAPLSVTLRRRSWGESRARC